MTGRRGNVLTIIRKEFQRFFGDRRMLLTTVLLPGLMIYVIYSLMGSFMSDRFSTDGAPEATVYVEHLPASLESTFDALPFEVVDAAGSDADALRDLVATGTAAAVYVVFPPDFDEAVAVYDLSSGAPAPNVSIYYNSTSVDSATAQGMIAGVLDTYEESLANRFDVNAGETQYDLAEPSDLTGMIYSMLVPMLMLIFVFSGCMAVAPESIAGEKERGTIATLLVTPMKRSELAIGKIVSLSVIALLSGLSSFLGTILSLPRLMGAAASEMDVSQYGVADYVQLLLVVLSTVLVVIAVISIISAAARSVKEATTAVSPLMVLVMLIGVTSMLGNGAPSGLLWYCIPLYNSVQAMNGIFSFSASSLQVAVTVCSNLLYAGVGAWVLTRMFNSEKVMFSR